jgi:hypothetical protein
LFLNPVLGRCLMTACADDGEVPQVPGHDDEDDVELTEDDVPAENDSKGQISPRDRGLGLFRDACTALATLGVTSVRIPYNGYGDEGCVEPPVATRSDDEWVDLPRELEEKLMDAAEWFLPDGWENCDGAYGELTLDVVQKRLDNELFWRVETSEREREGIDL